MQISNYEINEKIYESRLSLVYRGIRKTDKQPVILKFLNVEYPSLEQVNSFYYEYEILKTFNSQNVIKVYDYIKYGNSFAIVLEDFDGIPLNANDWKILNISSILKLFIKIIDIIEEVHKNNVIHKDISPANILWNRENNTLKIIDFGIATKLSNEKILNINPEILEGKLAYISPEQTGRMNRTVDYRADFYSLGATFYEVLTGQQPFHDAKDEMELIYNHIAKEPVKAHEINYKIPLTLSKIVNRLMSKNAEDRYQSTFGLRNDLEMCLEQLNKKGHIEDFELCQKDELSNFRIPQKLYGRENDIKILTDNFNMVCKGQSKITFVSGFSGIGKTKLIEELHKTIISNNAYFISGKYNQLKNDVPYSSIINAFREFIHYLLTEDSQKITFWKGRFLSALGLNGQIIIDVIPEFELIIGKQHPVPTLPPTESENRFVLVFKNFLDTIATKEHPLIIFLDDLQWADNASLNLIERLVELENERYLFIIGSYRDNEIDERHPLEFLIRSLNNKGIVFNNIKLKPLLVEDINQLISDALKSNLEKTKPLAELVLSKTEGNPFFVNEFLKFIFEKKLIIFNFNLFSWEWDLNSIEKTGIPDNIIQLMITKLNKLSKNAKEVLKLASCIGNTFDLNKLTIIKEVTKEEIVENLWEALDLYFIYSLDDSYRFTHNLEEINPKYKFTHDNIQQTIYSLIPENEKKALHLKIGRLLFKNFSTDEEIFDIVNHMNIGKELITDESEKIQLAHFNLMAGKKAKRAVAYGSAFNYIKNCLDLLGEPTCKKEYDLCLKAHIEGAEIAYINGDFGYMEELSDNILTKVENIAPKVEVYDIKVRAQIAKNNPIGAITLALEVLNLLGINIAENPDEATIGQKFLEVQKLLTGKEVKDLATLPKMTDLEKLSAIKIISTVMPITYVAKPSLVPVFACTMVQLSIIYGNAPSSPFGYATYGLVMCGSGDINTGYKFGELAIDLLEILDAKEFKSRTYFYVYLFIFHWKGHLRDSLTPALDGYKVGIETGDIANATSNLLLYGHHAYIAGEELTKLSNEMKEYSNIILKLKQDFIFNYNELYRYAILSWLEEGKNKNEAYFEDYYKNMLPVLEETQNISAIWIIYLNKVIFDYSFENYEEAYKNCLEAEKYIVAGTGAITPPLYYLYNSLTLLNMYSEESQEEKISIMKKVEDNQEKMKKWADFAPMNFSHKWFLVEAEKLKALKNNEAEAYYEEAINLAHINGYINEEALSYELAGKFYLENNKERIGNYYLAESIYAYQRWGAIVKVNQLREKYNDNLIKFSSKNNGNDVTKNSSLSVESFKTLDLATVLKASQVISNEVELKTLLEKIMYIAVENAGAQIGSYFSVDKENLSILIELTKGSECKYLAGLPLDKYEAVSKKIINYVARTSKDLVFDDAYSSKENLYDEYIQKNATKSLLCMCIKRNNEVKGILYFENNLSKGAFTRDRIHFLKMLLGQINISLENARLYNELKTRNEELEKEVEKRTQELTILNKNLLENNEKLNEIAKTDYLTKLLNRRFMIEELEKEIENYKDSNKTFGIIIIDIDNFKKFNDTYGHDCGDFVLVSVSQKIKSLIGSKASLSRWGGEEFLALFPNSSIKSVKKIAEEIRETIFNCSFNYYKILNLKISLTLGVSEYKRADETIDNLIKRADEALYEGKNTGRNKVAVK